MPITGPFFAVEGDPAVALTGSNMSVIAQIYMVAFNGFAEIAFPVDSSARTANSATVDLQLGLAEKIAGAVGAIDGCPLNDHPWKLKWRTKADNETTDIELEVSLDAPVNIAQREIANSKKFPCGWLKVTSFSETDQQYGPVVTVTNTVNYTKTDGKAAGYLEGIERTMTETVTLQIWSTADQKYRDLPVSITPFGGGGSGGEFTEEFTPEFT